MVDFEKEFGYFEGFLYRPRNKSVSKTVYDVGINDSPFVVQPTINSKKYIHPAYYTWYNLLTRCYSAKYKEKYPTYINAFCCDEWLVFTNFARWFKNNYIHKYHLDKDLLFKENKEYSPNTCIYIPMEINEFTTLRNNDRGQYPLGVTLHKGRFISRIGKERVNLGSFNTSEEAHQAWQKAKLEQAKSFNFGPLQRIINQLQYDLDNRIETFTL